MQRIAGCLRSQPHHPGAWLAHAGQLARGVSSSSSPHAADGDEATSSASGQSNDPEARTVRSKLLESALQYVPERGWSQAALVLAARELGLSPAVTGIIPNGEGGLVLHFMRERCVKSGMRLAMLFACTRLLVCTAALSLAFLVNPAARPETRVRCPRSPLQQPPMGRGARVAPRLAPRLATRGALG